MGAPVRRLMVLDVLLLLSVVGCGDERGVLEGSLADVPECGDVRELVVAGELDGHRFEDVVVQASSSQLSNPADPFRELGRLWVWLPEVDFESPAVDASFEGTLVLGYGENPARAVADLPEMGLGGEVVGNCEDGNDFPGLISLSADGQVIGMVFRDLRTEPFCNGRRVPGYLAMCYRRPE